MVVVPPQVLAQGQGGGIDAQLLARVVQRDADGKETLRSADSARPGDVIDYTVTYANRTSAPVKGVQATLPIPADSTVYIPDSAQPAAVQASVDGNRFEPVPLRHIVVGADGRSQTRDVPLDQYRFLRWNIGDLAAGDTKVVRARVRMTSTAETTADTASEVRP
jgi:uncharacterized repeat protein (TIGR01451 family)